MFRHLSSTLRWVTTSTMVLLLLAGLIIALFIPMVTHPVTAHANTDCGTNGIALNGSSWLNGGGVDICNHPGNGSHYCLAISGDPVGQNCPAGYVWSGDEWQCVELVNRLYLTKRWTNATWYGNGNTLVNKVPSGLIKQNNGSISYINSGDVITLNGYTDGHAGIINTIDSNGTIHIKNQNADLDSSAYISSGSLSSGNAIYSMAEGTWKGYSVQAIIHHPGGGTPTAISRSSTSMDLFYTDGRNLVNYGWNSTSGWSTTSWADPGGTIGQPAVVSRTSDTMDVFYTTGQHKLIHKGWWANTGWVYFDVLLSGDVAGDPTAIARDWGNIQVFYRTMEGEIKSIYWTSSGGWNTNPQNLYPSGASTDPYAVTRSSDSMEVFFGNTSGNIVHLGWSSTYGWVTQSWGTNSPVKNKPTAIVRNSGGDMSSYYQMNNGNVGEEAWDWQYGWSGQYWTAQLAGSPSATAGVHNVIDDFYRETGGNIVDRYFNGTNWQTTNIVGAGSATGNLFAITRGTTSQEVFYWNGSKLMDANWNTTSHSWSTSKIN